MSARVQRVPPISLALNWSLLRVRHEVPRCVISASPLFFLVGSFVLLSTFSEKHPIDFAPQPRWLVPRLSPRRPGFGTRSVRVGFVAHKVVVVEDFCGIAGMGGKYGTPIVTARLTRVRRGHNSCPTYVQIRPILGPQKQLFREHCLTTTANHRSVYSDL